MTALKQNIIEKIIYYTVEWSFFDIILCVEHYYFNKVKTTRLWPIRVFLKVILFLAKNSCFQDAHTRKIFSLPCD